MVIVQKFGGTSLAGEKKREAACLRVKEAIESGYKVCAVVSAMGRRGEPYATDTLIGLARGIHKNIASRELDLLISCGEVISAVLMVQELGKIGVAAMALSGGQAGIVTNTRFGDASILTVDPAHLQRHLDEDKVVVVAGFQGRTESGDITTLGRGGSDTTATALGAALDAAFVEVYTDVEGIMTADPKIVRRASTIPIASYEEVCHLAWEGAKIIHPRAVEIAQRAQIPIWIRALDAGSRKTLITGGERYDRPWRIPSQRKPVTGITYRSGLSHVVVRSSVGPELSGVDVVFSALRGLSLDLVNVFPDRLAFVVDKADTAEVRRRLSSRDLSIDVAGDQAKVTVVGSGLHGRPGVMDTMVGTLSREGISVRASSDSNITISCLIDEGLLPEALLALHAAFGLAERNEAG